MQDISASKSDPKVVTSEQPTAQRDQLSPVVDEELQEAISALSINPPHFIHSPLTVLSLAVSSPVITNGSNAPPERSASASPPDTGNGKLHDTTYHSSSSRRASILSLTKCAQRSPGLAKSPVSPFSPSNGYLLTKNRSSVAYFVDLTSPSKTKKFPLLSSKRMQKIMRRIHAAKSPTALVGVPLNLREEGSSFPFLDADTNAKAVQTDLDLSLKLRFNVLRRKTSPSELTAKLAARLSRAKWRKGRADSELQHRLARRAQKVAFRRSIQHQRDTLRVLKISAKADYKMSAAVLRRTIALRERVDRNAAIVMNAKTVATINKLKRLITLQKSYSADFADTLGELGVRGETIDWSHTFQGGDGIILDDQDFSATEEEYILISPSISPVSSSTGSSKSSQFSPLLAEHMTLVSDEPLATKIRRSKSLPTLLFEDIDEYEYAELTDLLPPVTRFTLRELGLEEIISSVQVRHDLYFDPELKFQPNTERSASRQAADAAYWEELEGEIRSNQLYRIPLLLHEVRYIMDEMLPSTEELAEKLRGQLDISLISQQLQHGILNIPSLIGLIAGIMHEHCSPARDGLVDEMQAACLQEEYTLTFRKCFQILEYMKLDYANHQLRKLRPFVMERAAEFEWRTFKDKLDCDDTSLVRTTNWILVAKKSCPPESPMIKVFHAAILDMIKLGSVWTTNDLPETLYLDSDRLAAFNDALQDIAILTSLLILFRQMAGPKCSVKHVEELKDVVWILLNDSEATLLNIALQLATSAGKIRGAPFTQIEIDSLHGLIERTLSPENKVYEIVQNRIYAQLEHYLQHGSLTKEDIMKHGLSQSETELDALGGKIKDFVELHKNVYGRLYEVILLTEEMDQSAPKMLNDDSEVQNQG